MRRRSSSMRPAPPWAPAVPFSSACAFSSAQNRGAARRRRLCLPLAVDAPPPGTREALQIWVTATVPASCVIRCHPASPTLAGQGGRHHTGRPTGVPTGSAVPPEAVVPEAVVPEAVVPEAVVPEAVVPATRLLLAGHMHLAC